MTTNYWQHLAAALRNHSEEELMWGLTEFMRASDPVTDWRDVLVGFAPYHDCARKLGLNPAGVFDQAAETVGGEVGDLARRFGRRTDVTPRAFGYLVADGPDGPFYRVGPVGPPENQPAAPDSN